jgi:GNAT superfamily N-acetyltransferase
VSVRIERAAWDDDDVQRLTAAQQAEIRARYDGKGEPGSPPTAADVSVVLVARDAAGRAVGCGALWALGDGVAEIKRMYVVPAHRGQGLSRAVLRALEECARASGWTTVRLETGPRQPEAAGLYRSAGYRPIGAFGAYAGDPAAVESLFFERGLDRAGTDPECSPAVG